MRTRAGQGGALMLNCELEAQARELEVRVMADGRLVAPGWPPPGFSTDDSDTGGPRIFIDSQWLLSPLPLFTKPDSLQERKRKAVQESYQEELRRYRLELSRRAEYKAQPRRNLAMVRQDAMENLRRWKESHHY